MQTKNGFSILNAKTIDFTSGLEGIQTPNLLIRSQTLYSVELRNHIIEVRRYTDFKFLQTHKIKSSKFDNNFSLKLQHLKLQLFH